MSLMPLSVVDALTAAGLVPVPRSGEDPRSIVVDLYDSTPGPRRVATLEVRRLSGSPTPGTLERLAARSRRSTGREGTGLLVVCDHASSGALRRADELGISLVGLEPAQVPHPAGGIRLGPGRLLPLGPRVPVHPYRETRRASWAPVQVLRSRVLLGRLTQRDVAALAGISQPRVAQAAAALGLVDDEPRSLLVDRWLDAYPGAGGVTTYWFGLSPPREQARAAVRAARQVGPADVVVSGDVAADVVAPVSRPVRAVVYSRQGLDLTAAGLTPSLSSEATLELTVPQDRGIFAFADRYWHSTDTRRPAEDLPLADPLQVLHDVRRSPSVDRDQSDEAMRRFLARADARDEE
ncbi:hypothetical protein [Kineosporia sp. A_224]|uniref:hypothetical protein n=1 Tax=Kineosporia sp. A_224 TaxID=1962180 RepID=UPI00117BAAAF|nr:hypothetical protein [Kineosporia sp. A_224]